MGKRNKKKNKNRNNNYHQNHKNHQNNNGRDTQNPEPQPKYEEFNDLVDNNIYDAEKIDDAGSSKKNILTIAIVVALALILTLLILLTTGLLKRENLSFLNFANNNFAIENVFRNGSESENSNAIDFVESIEELNIKQDRSETGPAMFSTVRLPMLINDSYAITEEMPKAGCDHIHWVTRRVSPTTMPLNATLREMFNYDQDLDFFIGNYVAKQENLSFDYAEIENRVAKVYLMGSVDKTETECPDRLAVQINWAALQFDTIDSVEIYLNGEPY